MEHLPQNLVNFREYAKIPVFQVGLKNFLKNFRPQFFFVLETRTIKEVKNIIEINITSGWRQKNNFCFWSSKP